MALSVNTNAGAMMALQLAHAIGHRIASIVPVAGLPLLGFLDEAVPSVPVAMMAVNGRLDQEVPANTSNGFLGAPEPVSPRIRSLASPPPPLLGCA